MEYKIKKANEKYRGRDYRGALEAYLAILRREADLARRCGIESNIKLCQSRIGTAFKSKNSEIIVYSCLVGDYEALKEPEVVDPSVRYILFTDNPDLKSDKWEVAPFDTLGLSPRRASRLPKLLPHRYLPEHEISVYIDASLTIITPDVARMVCETLQEDDLAAYPHFQRSCIYDEIAECLRLGKTTAPEAERVSRMLAEAAFPRNLGLVENAFLVRRNTGDLRELNEAWHALFSQNAGRDQFYLMYLAWKYDIAIRRIADAPQFRESPHVRFTRHDWTRKPQIAPARLIRWNRSIKQKGALAIDWKKERTS